MSTLSKYLHSQDKHTCPESNKNIEYDALDGINVGRKTNTLTHTRARFPDDGNNVERALSQH